MSRRERTAALRHMLDHAREASALASGQTRADLDANRLLNLALGSSSVLSRVGGAPGRTGRGR